MPQRTVWESLKVAGDEVVATVRHLVREGNVRRIVVRQGTKTLIEIPLTLGVVGTMVAPVLAAVGALAALIGDCTILVERVEGKSKRKAPGPRRARKARKGPPL